MTTTTKMSPQEHKRLIEENNPEAVSTYKRYLNATHGKVAIARSEWDNYYEYCWQSPAAENFREQMAAFKRSATAEVRERATWAKQLRGQEDFTPHPKSLDPYAIENDQLFLMYKRVLYAVAHDENRPEDRIFEE